MRSPKPPQEKKRLSLAKDGRNLYGENDKASRKAIPLAKARVNRANRRADTILLADSIGSPDEELDTKAEEAVEEAPPKGLAKMAGRPT